MSVRSWRFRQDPLGDCFRKTPKTEKPHIKTTPNSLAMASDVNAMGCPTEYSTQIVAVIVSIPPTKKLSMVLSKKSILRQSARRVMVDAIKLNYNFARPHRIRPTTNWQELKGNHQASKSHEPLKSTPNSRPLESFCH